MQFINHRVKAFIQLKARRLASTAKDLSPVSTGNLKVADHKLREVLVTNPARLVERITATFSECCLGFNLHEQRLNLLDAGK